MTSDLSREHLSAGAHWPAAFRFRPVGKQDTKTFPNKQIANIGFRYWIAYPVLSNLSGRTLKAAMPVEAPHKNAPERCHFTHLEALARLLCGIAPWLELTDGDGPELDLRQHYRYLARQSLSSAEDPTSPDYMNFNRGQQP